MKFKIQLLPLFLVFSFTLLGQTKSELKKIQSNTNTIALSAITSLESEKAKNNKILAQTLAKVKNWDLTIDYPDGGFAELIRVNKQGNPVYFRTYNQGAGVTSRANQLYTGGGLGLQIEGQNMLAGEWDGGGVLLSHELFEGRVSQMDTASGTHPHSVHVAGTIIGTNQVQGGIATGMAFKANLHAYDWNNDSAEVATAASNGLLLSNHSYGYNPFGVSFDQFGKYDDSSRVFDEIMYNAPHYLFVNAAGNTRGYNITTGDNGYDLLTGHSLSKNSMTVAAVHEVTNYTGASSVTMSDFSSWGPADDGRIKPDISAKGVDVYSAVDGSNSSYDTYNGTSMASPSTAGTLLLLQQYYNQLNSNFMLSATLRGLAIHSADETGTSPGPDYRYGWGLLNAEKAAEIIRDNGLLSNISEEKLTNGNSFSITVDALGTEPLMASITWTDPAGNAVTNSIDDYYEAALVNDLDIRVTQNTVTYLPWVLDVNNMTSPATKGDNIVDNVEKVQVNSPSGSYTITVTHKGTLATDQNFSLIMSGISFNDFYITSSAATQEVCATDTTATYNLDLSTISGFSDTVTFATTGLPASINKNFTPSTLSSAGSFNLDLTNFSSVPAGIYPFTITGQSATDSATFDAVFHIFDNNFPVQTLSFPTDTATAIDPIGNLEWILNTNAQEYDIEIATDSGFANTIEMATVSQITYQPTQLDFDTTYYWRVKPKNSCSIGSFSNTFSFTTFCVAPTNVTVSNVLIDNVTVSWNEIGSATSWEIEVIEVGVTPIGVGISAPTNPFLLTGLNSNTDYIVYVRSNCSAGNFSDWIASDTFTTGADFCNGDHFYDTGGASGSYSDNENIITTISPSTGFNTVEVVFNSFNLEGCCDSLRIYDGSDTNAPLIGQFTSNPGTITASAGSLTFHFTSDSSVTYAGWDATVTCLNISCPSPSNLIENNVLATSVDLSWNVGSTETSWEIEYGITGFTQGTGTIIQTTTNPHTLTGLNASTNYDIYLKANCGTNPGDDDSSWIGPITFMTLCDVTSAPYVDDVELHQGTTSSDINNCWVSTPNNISNAYRWDVSNSGFTPSSGTGPTQANSGNHYFYTECSGYNTGDVAELYTPLIDISALSVPQLKFYYHMYGFGMGSLHVDVFNNGTWYDDEIVISGQQHTLGSDSWTEQNLVLAGFTGQVKIRFRGIRGDSYEGDMAIDDIQVIEAPTCPEPTNFTYTNVLANSVYLNWDAGNTETNWEIEYGLTGFTQGNGTVEQVSTNPFTLTGLTFSTSYDVYLRANCGTNPGDDDSLWVGPITFTTLVSCPKPTNFNESNITASTVDLSWTNGGLETAWEIEYGLTGFTQGNGTVEQVSTNPFTLTGLIFSTSYDVYLRANCGTNPGDDDSLWAGPITFTTLCSSFNTPFMEDIEAFNNDYYIENCWSSNPLVNSYNYGWHIASNGSTYTSYTGPAQANSGTTFFYTEANNGSQGDIAVLVTPIIDLSSLTVPQLIFFYHMYGYDMGSLHVDIFNNGNWTNDLIIIDGQQQTSDYNPWEEQTLLLSAYTGEVQVRFRGIRGDGYRGDMSIDDVQIIEAPTCPMPTNFTETNSTSSSVDLSWTTGYIETDWEIEYGITGFTQGTGTIISVNTNPYTLSGLIRNTTYDVYLRANCGANSGDDDSLWVDPISFTTLCGSFDTPFIENIEAFNNHYYIENCWSANPLVTGYTYGWHIASNGSTPSSNTGPSQANSGTTFFYTEASSGSQGDVAELMTPTIDISNLIVPQLSFYYHMYGTGIESLHIDVFNNGNWNNDELVISGSQQNSSSSPWIEETLGLNAYTGNIQIRFRTIRTYSYYGDISIDDIKVWEAPSCPKPTNFNKTNISVDSVDLSWTAGGVETAWEVEYGTSGFTQGTGSVIQVNTNQLTLSNLNQDTNYDVYLRANCNEFIDDNSIWVGPISFTTYVNYCNGAHFYDSGGEFGNYSNDESIITTIVPTDGYNAVEVTFNSFNVSQFDTLRIYNGPDINSTLLGVYHGGGLYDSDFPDSFISTHTSGALTFWFTSGYLVSEHPDGWDATVNCLNISCYDPTKFSSINETETSIDLIWTPGNLETNWEIEYGLAGFTQGTGTTIQTNTNFYNITGLIQNSCYDVYLRSICSDSNSNWIKDSFITIGSSTNNLVANLNQTNGEVTLNWNIDNYTLTEDFNDNYANYWQFDRGSWYVYQGYYIGSGSGVISSYYPQTFSNYVMEVKMKKTGWYSTPGIFFNGDPTDYLGNGTWENTYSLEYSNYTSANWKLSKIVNGNWTTIKGWTDSNAIIAGPDVWNNIKIVSANGYFDIYFNEILTGSFYDDTFPSGLVGFSNYADGNNSSTANVDDFTLTELNCNNSQGVVYYNVYRDGVIIATTTQPTFTDTLSTYGTYNYYVTSVYDGVESNISNTDEVIWDNTTSVKDLSQYNFKYYPNPFKNTLTLSANQKFTSIKVYSILGQELMDVNLENQSNLTIDMSKLNVGTYFMKVEINNKTSSMKIIKK